MRIVLALMVIMLVSLQYRLWVGEGSLAELHDLESRYEVATRQNMLLRQRNLVLADEVRHLKEGLGPVEERARSELGMIREGETLYVLLPR
ncbi:MAG: septum formation initiator family protein [Gammaproteobacteria bacterium]|jgi:cell division protein FtsB